MCDDQEHVVALGRALIDVVAEDVDTLRFDAHALRGFTEGCDKPFFTRHAGVDLLQARSGDPRTNIARRIRTCDDASGGSRA